MITRPEYVFDTNRKLTRMGMTDQELRTARSPSVQLRFPVHRPRASMTCE
ncbi:hypothetical protein Mal52_16990 [Symmachiella dynata]|uniref:Uncharacterized protein n=1 Tax=Symmachiella dynata TaxID=2527995 RepID=A0A517ZL88_9PLAN|nr:hypothetical protein Mal52_16990 [Symmachiella dynata]